MNILIIDMLSDKFVQKEASAVPPVGAQVGCFNQRPAPVVTHQIWYPNFEQIQHLNLINNQVDVMVVVNGHSLG